MTHPCPKPTIGLRFRNGYADANALWEVTAIRGRYCDCVIVDDPDYFGVRKAFYADEVLRLVAAGEAARASFQRNADFYSSLPIGSVVHYHYSGSAFVRCLVVDRPCSDEPAIQRSLQPVALVGTWRPYDLPRRHPDGTIDEGHNARLIRTGQLIHPHSSNLYECPGSPSSRATTDPRPLEPLNLTLPALDAAAQARADLLATIARVRDTLCIDHPEDPASIRTNLLRAKAMIDAALTSTTVDPSA